ncbi:AAA-ATPase_like domain-containing protein [Gammaproteobacteria bacterium]
MRYPYGLSDFHRISAERRFYIDRTDRIRLIEESGDQLLLLRPRRFGKSLWLSTLENYYDLAKADEFEKLFGHLKIGQDPTPLHNRYFVMNWNFSLVDPQGDVDAIRAVLFRHINVRIRAVVAKYRTLLGEEEVLIREEDAVASFQSLLSAISLTPYRLYLLVDEYDNFANEVMVSHQQGTNRYQELVGGEGVIKTMFKAVKDGAEGRGLERVFMTGVSPVVLADITSGYNVVENVSLYPEYADLCGFHEEEIRLTLERIVAECDQPPAKAEEALELMRTFYNGYRFCPRPECGQIYNPTLAIYFFQHLAKECRYPEEMLDSNLAMDRNRIKYVARLPHGQKLVTDALNPANPIAISRLENRFGVEMMLSTPQDHGFLASLLYYFGVLTYCGRDAMGKLLLKVPNLVVRRLYVERIREALLPGYEVNEQRLAVTDRFYTAGELAPLCDFIEQRFFTVFDNRDGRWSNELVVKTAFLTTLFNDTAYLMDSETAIDKGYADLTLIIRPDMRHYAFLDHLLEFKHLGLQRLGLTNEQVRAKSREELTALPLVQTELKAAQAQLARYRETLERVYGEKLRLRTHAVIGLGLTRLVWA